jgi:hypothetical protein
MSVNLDFIAELLIRTGLGAFEKSSDGWVESEGLESISEPMALSLSSSRE